MKATIVFRAQGTRLLGVEETHKTHGNGKRQYHTNDDVERNNGTGCFSICKTEILLTHCGLQKPYYGVDLGQHWLRQCLVAWRHQASRWTSADHRWSVAYGFTRRAHGLIPWHVFVNYGPFLVPHLTGANESTSTPQWPKFCSTVGLTPSKPSYEICRNRGDYKVLGFVYIMVEM